MKSPVFAALVLSATLAATLSAQVKTVAVANDQPAAKANTNQPAGDTTRVRTPATKVAFSRDATGRARAADTSPSDTSDTPGKPNASPDASIDGHSDLRPNGSTKTSVTLPQNGASSAAIASAATQIYRVGVGDVLDIRLSNNPMRTSTLFTVLEHGVLEYPFAGNPVVVSGMTTSEIAALLRKRIKIFENPNVAVEVREYMSHAVIVSGLVTAPGKKILRREALPLYALLAEALVLPEAACATVTRKGAAPIVVDIKDANLSATLVLPGDAIKISGPPPPVTDFYFIGGEINSPGQKAYHVGITLTQGILASGGMKTAAGTRVRVSRQGADGKLMTKEFNLRKIQTGKDPDPVLQKGDRVEVMNTN